MTGNDAPPGLGGLPAGPPWSVDLLADLHAGALDPSVAAALRARVDTDPDARATLAALDATRAALADLPPLRMPDAVAGRIHAALNAEATARATSTPHPAPPSVAGPPVVDLATAARERRRRRGLIAGAGLLTAAAAAVAVIAVSGLTGGQTAGSPQAGTQAAASRTAAVNASDQALAPLAVTAGNLGTALDDAVSATDYGPLGAPGRLDACLRANQVDPARTRPLGAREVSVDGTAGVLLVLPTGMAARFRLLVVAPDCGPGNPAVVAEATVGR